ncbi:hypothetical protein [Cellulosimicrobium marinum]|uniref:hypothetical protein n=1 Tax=Cellulosimicrobium marinum TaxID=1638992 RepID=UPI001E4B5AAB|nr:hypothetical protein [Cellulosimicrobium marinum]MCB7136336.1 hypothetical protein [Cellulosimicrobium marinum]
MGYAYTSVVPGDDPSDGVDDTDEAPPLATLDVAGARALAERYLAHHLLSSGARAERLESEASTDARDEVTERVLREPDPFPVLDALVALGFERVPVDDHAFLALVAAGPVEDALVERSDLRDAVAERCRRDAAWHLTVQGVWADAALVPTFPPPLDSLVTTLGGSDRTGSDRPKGRVPAARRPSRRQQPRGRGRGR